MQIGILTRPRLTNHLAKSFAPQPCKQPWTIDFSEKNIEVIRKKLKTLFPGVISFLEEAIRSSKITIAMHTKLMYLRSPILS